MNNPSQSRRSFIHRLTATAGAVALGAGRSDRAQAGSASPLHIACNQYPWAVFYQREGKNFGAEIDTALGQLASTGIEGYEPMATSPEQVRTLHALLRKHGLEMRSFYVNSVLHDPTRADQSVDEVVRIAAAARAAGGQIAVTNPSPLRWGGPENKDDRQLQFQAQTLNRLGEALRREGVRLAYHNHDIELRQAAREFHHMLGGTDPDHVGLCLDAHWIYRGAGNSSVALFDIVRLYAPRIIELHLRQSRQHIWTETLTEGDIDYPRLVEQLVERGVKPHLVLEQAVEAGSPNTMDVVEAHRKTRQYAQRVLAPLGG